MKKVLAFLLTMVLVAAASVCVAFAAPSAEAQGVISGITVNDANDKEVTVKIEKIDGKVNKYFYNALTGLKSETKNKTLKIVGHYNVEIEGKPEYPSTVSLNVLGISDSSEVFVLLQNGKEVVSVTPEVEEGKLTFDFDDSVEKLAIVVDGKTATNVEKENNVLSPQTADNTIYVALIALIALATLVIVPKKVKA